MLRGLLARGEDFIAMEPENFEVGSRDEFCQTPLSLAVERRQYSIATCKLVLALVRKRRGKQTIGLLHMDNISNASVFLHAGQIAAVRRMWVTPAPSRPDARRTLTSKVEWFDFKTAGGYAREQYGGPICDTFSNH